MLNNIEKIQTEDREIILIGTAHVSQESVGLVKETIERENPDVVGVELCEQRHKTLLNKEKWNETIPFRFLFEFSMESPTSFEVKEGIRAPS